MKVLPEPTPTVSASAAPPSLPARLTFPAGIIGFPDHRQGELISVPDEAPFRWLKLTGPHDLHFVVIEPAGFVPDYLPELFDEDAAALGITGADDAAVLLVVTVARTQPATATANLVGPVVVNRHTGEARQVVLANHSHYNARHPLVTGA